MPERETRYTSAGAITSAKRESKQTNKIDSRFVFVVTSLRLAVCRLLRTLPVQKTAGQIGPTP